MSRSSAGRPAGKRQPPASSRQSSQVPPPFTPVSETLAPFADILDQSKVYITHVDTQPRRLKRQVFAVPVLLNVAIAVLLAWRAYHAVPKYFLYMLTIMGQQTSETVDADALTSGQLTAVILRRTGMLVVDYALATVILPWPFAFFLDFPGNPVTWRWQVGIKDEEIIVRESRGWGASELVGGTRKGSESPVWANRIAPAVEMHYIRGKTGYVMMGKEWELDFERMVWAERFGKERGLRPAEFRTTVFVYVKDAGWLSWTADWEDDDETREEEARKKIKEFHDKLDALGRESLFFRWIELLQYESNSGKAMSRDSLIKQARIMFEEQGVDFDDFAESMGGAHELPGMADAAAAG